jgi:rare lipoprotein A (peptidoglycan hydrolase)
MRVITTLVLICIANVIMWNNISAHNASVFCDHHTATGSMNCGAPVFAHKTLPLGSWRWLVSGHRRVRAQVVDRGPYVRGREFDLSPGLARMLGINGLGSVHMTGAHE